MHNKNQDIFDYPFDKNLTKKKIVSTRSFIIIIVLIIISIATNILIPVYTFPDVLKKIDPAYASKKDVFITMSIPIAIEIPLASFILALIVSFIPYKNFSYREKYIPFGLLILLCIEMIISIKFITESL